MMGPAHAFESVPSNLNGDLLIGDDRPMGLAWGQSKVKNPDSWMLQFRTKDPPFDNGQRVLVGRLHCGYLAITKWMVLLS